MDYPNMHTTNLRWRAANIWKMCKSAHLSNSSSRLPQNGTPWCIPTLNPADQRKNL